MKIKFQEEGAKALMEEDFCRVCGSDGLIMNTSVDFDLNEVVIETICVTCNDKGSYTQKRYPITDIANIDWLEDGKEYKYYEYSWDGPEGDQLIIETPKGMVTIMVDMAEDEEVANCDLKEEGGI